MLAKVRDLVTSKGFQVIYRDTDSNIIKLSVALNTKELLDYCSGPTHYEDVCELGCALAPIFQKADASKFFMSYDIVHSPLLQLRFLFQLLRHNIKIDISGRFKVFSPRSSVEEQFWFFVTN